MEQGRDCLADQAEEKIPVTSVHRTIFDLAAPASVDDVSAMIKEAEYLNLWDRLSLWHDRARDRVLKVAGYSVIHLTWAQLDSEPEAVASDLRSLLLGDR